eukprot:scpid18321/ scgid13011/ 
MPATHSKVNDGRMMDVQSRMHRYACRCEIEKYDCVRKINIPIVSLFNPMRLVTNPIVFHRWSRIVWLEAVHGHISRVVSCNATMMWYSHPANLILLQFPLEL